MLELNKLMRIVVGSGRAGILFSGVLFLGLLFSGASISTLEAKQLFYSKRPFQSKRPLHFPDEARDYLTFQERIKATKVAKQYLSFFNRRFENLRLSSGETIFAQTIVERIRKAAQSRNLSAYETKKRNYFENALQGRFDSPSFREFTRLEQESFRERIAFLTSHTSYPKNPSLGRSKQIVLTYDDGPVGNTELILNELGNESAVFFMMGKPLERSPTAQRIFSKVLESNSFVAIHGYTHDNSNDVSEKHFFRGLLKSVLIQENLEHESGLHQKETYYRFPYGAYGRSRDYHPLNVLKEVSELVYGENCINYVLWDVDTVDWVLNSGYQVYQNIIAQLNGGSGYVHRRLPSGKFVPVSRHYSALNGGIVLMHDTKSFNLKTTQFVMESLSIPGKALSSYRIVPLNQVENYKFDHLSCTVTKARILELNQLYQLGLKGLINSQ